MYIENIYSGIDKELLNAFVKIRICLCVPFLIGTAALYRVCWTGLRYT